ncbi:hypothetical protein [Microbispora rosea]|uniref:hypothetical protein n=1 Tax=Microbispora rosea TaxID=58117 RepID=UPI0004C4762D|nr:hypothetical protein [Microbispora rosea]
MDIVPATGEHFEETLAAANPDLLRTGIREFPQRMFDTEVEQICGAGYGEVSDQRVSGQRRATEVPPTPCGADLMLHMA